MPIIVIVFASAARRLAIAAGLRRHHSFRSFDDLVEFAPVEPHAPALWTVIDLHALSF
jgi:hypothetical protein